MDKNRIERTRAIFDGAIELNPDQREKFINEKCGDDEELKKEIYSLIRSLETSDDFLERPLEINQKYSEAFKDPNLNRQIGSYLIEGEAGMGGMGVVYSGRRNDREFEQKVAIKILKYGLNSDYLLKRFRIERQTLANLQHENIARLLDGGRTDDGLPYLVMEFIEGIPITEYCSREELSVEERLELFLKVCNAVQYAHQNLVIHRDIKPGNILVTKEGNPKLLDFGIAKLINEDLSETTEGLTRTGVFHLTPEYASPEQIKGEKISTASDIYSLGVLLYELLTGKQPYRITNSSPVEISKVVTEDIVRPSDKVKQKLPDEKIKFQVKNPEKFSVRLKGDLDNIVLKAMQKDPSRRYVSVEQFAEDINKHLNGLPVIAQKDTTGYRLSKFIKRHKVGFAASVGFIIFLIAALIAISWQANVAEKERDNAQVELRKFEEINNFLLDMFSSADPGSKGRDIKVYDLLEKASEDVEVNLKKYPRIKSAIKTTLGATFIGLGEYEKAKELLTESHQSNIKLFGINSKESAHSAHQLGLCYDWIGNYELADSFYNEGIKIYENLDGKPLKGLADNLNDYGTYLTNLGLFDSSTAVFKKALDIYGMYNETKGKKEAVTINNLAVNLHHQNKVDEAEKYYREAMQILTDLYGINRPEIGSMLNNLAFIYLDNKRFDESEKAFKQGNEIKAALLGENHPSLGLGYVNLGMLNFIREDYKRAEEPLLDAIELFKRNNAPEDPILSLAHYWLGRVYLEWEKLSKSEEQLRKSVKIREKVYTNKNHRTWSSKGELGICLFKQKKYSEAERLIVGSLEFYKNDTYKDMKKLTRYTEYSAKIYEELGKQSKAEQYYAELEKLNGNSEPAK